jgi:hypothetical protein
MRTKRAKGQSAAGWFYGQPGFHAPAPAPQEKGAEEPDDDPAPVDEVPLPLSLVERACKALDEGVWLADHTNANDVHAQLSAVLAELRTYVGKGGK